MFFFDTICVNLFKVARFLVFHFPCNAVGILFVLKCYLSVKNHIYIQKYIYFIVYYSFSLNFVCLHFVCHFCYVYILSTILFEFSITCHNCHGYRLYHFTFTQ